MSNSPDKPRPLRVPARRVSRLGQLGSMTAGVAGSMAYNGIKQLGQVSRPSLRGLMLTPSNITRVTDQLAKMRGAAMKIGQLMSMDTGDMLPPELTIILARLRDNAHPMPPAQLKAILNTQWRAGWLKSFAKLDVRPIAAASIGQVHRAQLKDGRDLAIKVQYPGVAGSIDADVANVGALMRMSGLLPKGFDLAPYLEEGRKQLHAETDYAREAAYLSRFGALMAKRNAFIVPQLHADWSTPDILAMDYVAGIAIEEATAEPQERRDAIATDLINLMLSELFDFGVMQTDPNFANYLYQPDTRRIVLLDFGAARDINGAVDQQYRDLMRAGLAGHVQAVENCARAIGFIAFDTAPNHVAQIVRLIGLVFDMVQAGATVDFANPNFSKQMQAEGFALAEGGFIPPPLPIDVLLLQRKFGGMFLLAARLGAQVDVRALLVRHLNE